MNDKTSQGFYVAPSEDHPATNFPTTIASTDTTYVIVFRLSDVVIVQLCFSLQGKFCYRVRHANWNWFGWFTISN